MEYKRSVELQFRGFMTNKVFTFTPAITQKRELEFNKRKAHIIRDQYVLFFFKIYSIRKYKLKIPI